MIEEEILRRAVAVFGIKAQLCKAQEECAELIVAVSLYMRQPFPGTFQELINEVADVKIMMGQLELILGGEAVGAMVATKLDRLRAEIVAAQADRAEPEKTTP